VEVLKNISLKINPPREEYLSLLHECKDLYNDIINWMYENGTYNKNRFHKACYFYYMDKYPNVKSSLQHAIRDMASYTCKRQKLQGCPPSKRSLTVYLTKSSFTLRGKQLTLIGSSKRYKEILHIPTYYEDIYKNWEMRCAYISYDRKNKQFWLHITYRNNGIVKMASDVKKEKVLGIDRGIYNPIVTSDGSFVGCGKEIRRKKGDYQYLRQQLQKKGTRSAKRKLRNVSGKEKRFVLNQNHILSKKVANSDNQIFVLERLKNMRKNKYSKKFNRKMGNWSYFQFEQFLKYKADALGKHVVYINPAYTSQECSSCGIVLKSQRKGNMYECSCGYKGHSDLNAAINIRNRFLTSPEFLKISGAIVDEPNESGEISGSSLEIDNRHGPILCN
jgi:IS605 OrfB family transposase